MRAVAVFPASREVKVIDHKDPRISQPDQVKLRILDVGICAALRMLDLFRRRSPDAMQTLIAGRYPPEQATELILGRPTGIKTVIAF